MTKTFETEKLEALAAEIVKLGYEASVDVCAGGAAFLRFAGVRSPEIRGSKNTDGGRYVWDGYVAKNPTTMAKRLIAFRKECEEDKAKRKNAWKNQILKARSGDCENSGTPKERLAVAFREIGAAWSHEFARIVVEMETRAPDTLPIEYVEACCDLLLADLETARPFIRR